LPLAGTPEQIVRLQARLVRLLELSGPPREERRQPELDDRAPGLVGGVLKQAVDGSQGLDGDRGVGLGPVVDQPLGALIHRIQHLEPSGVVGRQQLDELGLQLERLAISLASFGLAHRVQEHVDRL
jgi:hypothetical protein